MSHYKKNKKSILKYQKYNPYYREYKRQYETGYREDNRVAWNLKSWKSIRKSAGKRTTLIKETDYLLSRFLGETNHVR